VRKEKYLSLSKTQRIVSDILWKDSLGVCYEESYCRMRNFIVDSKQLLIALENGRHNWPCIVLVASILERKNTLSFMYLMMK
jgi:hypothetical protein